MTATPRWLGFLQDLAGDYSLPPHIRNRAEELAQEQEPKTNLAGKHYPPDASVTLNPKQQATLGDYLIDAPVAAGLADCTVEIVRGELRINDIYLQKDGTLATYSEQEGD